MQRSVDEAKLAAIKLRTWTDKGHLQPILDRHTNIRTENNWLFCRGQGPTGKRPGAYVRASRAAESLMPFLVALGDATGKPHFGRGFRPANALPYKECGGEGIFI
jgi:hypothetical protein